MVQYRIEVDCIRFTQILHQISQNMKLHLPKKLFAAVMALFAMGVSTTLGAEVISINFGASQQSITQEQFPDASDALLGVNGANWNNVTNNVTDVNLINSSGNAAGTLTLTSRSSWTSGAGTATLENAMQKGYIDFQGGDKVEMNLTVDHISTDLHLYFSGDSGSGSEQKYTAINVNGISYIGGKGSDNDEAGKTEHWGNREAEDNKTISDDNSITLKDIGGVSSISNIPSGSNAYRATFSGMQVVVNDIDEHTLAAGSTTAMSLTATTGYLGITSASGGSTLDISAASLKGVQATANDLTIVGNGEVGRLWAKQGTSITLNGTIKDDTDLDVGGLGSITIGANQSLGALTGGVGTTLNIEDGVAVSVKELAFMGTLNGGVDSKLNIYLDKNGSSTVNGITVTNKSGNVSINALATGITDVTCGNGAKLEIASSGGTLLVSGTEGTKVTLSALSLSGNSLTALTVGDGVTMSGTFDTIGLDASGRELQVGKGIKLEFTAAEWGVNMGNGTLTINGGEVVTNSLITGNNGYDKSSVINITDGGRLEVTGDSDCTGKNGSVFLGHWASWGSGTFTTINVADGEFSALNCLANVGWQAQKTTIDVGEKGIVNFKGMTRPANNNYTEVDINVAAGGVMNLGEYGINITTSHTVSINVDGTLGSLSDKGWSSTKAITLNDGATVQLSVWDVANKQYTDTAADIDLTAGVGGSGALTLAGSGRLLVSSALAHDVSSTGGKLVFTDIAGCEFLGTGDTFSGYGDSTTDGYTSAQYRIAGSGSTITEATVLIGAETEKVYSVAGGVMTVDDGTVFVVNTVVDRANITEWKEGTSLVLGAGSVYHTSVVEDVGVISGVEDATAAVYLQNTEGKDLLKITNLPVAAGLNVTIGGEGNNEIVCSDSTFTGNFTVLSGAILKQSDAEGSDGWDISGEGYDVAPERSITVQDDAIFDINGKEAYYHIVLEEGATLANTGADVSYVNHRNLALVELTGDATVNAQSTLGVVGGSYQAAELLLNGHTLTVEGGDTFLLNNCTVGAGTILVKNGSLELLEYNGPRKTDLSAATVEVTTSTVVGEDNTETVVQGGIYYGREGNTAIQVGHLVASGGYVQTTAGRELIINEVSGSAFTKYGTGVVTLKDGITIAEDLTITSDVDAGSIGLSTVNVAAGKTLSITGTATADTLALTGGGNLTIAVLNASTVQMSSGMDIGSLTAGAQIAYTDVASIGAIGTLGGDTIIDLFGVSDSLTNGINLGIAYTEENLAKLQLIALDDMVDADGNATWELVDDNGFIKLQGIGGTAITLHTDWDVNWGGAGLAGAPATMLALDQTVVVTKQAEGKVAIDAIDGINYLDGDKIAISVNATQQTNDLYVTGGYAGNIGGTVSEVAVDSVWIEVEDGTYHAIVGGTLCNTWGGGSGTAVFSGDTHILMREGSTNFVIGGNMNDANGGATFTGDSYISIYEGASVNTAVVGGSTFAHNQGTTFNGNTNVFVYSVMSASDSFIVGGNMQFSGSPKDSYVNGNTHVTVDLASYSGTDTDFNAKVIGAGLTYQASSQDWSGGSLIGINGDTNVEITGKEGITFKNKIIGGGYHINAPQQVANQSATSVTGSTNVTINAGVFDEGVIGGTYISLPSGTAGTSTIGASNINIKGGTYNGMVVGGTWHKDQGSTSSVGDISVSISGEGTSLNHRLIGGSYIQTGANTTSAGNISIDLLGGTLSNEIIGGHRVDGTGSAALTASTGDITVTVDGATTTGVLYGGSLICRNNNGATVQQGNVTVSLLSGTVSGNVYAAGSQLGSTAIRTASTTVEIGSAVALTQGNTVSAGYATASGTVTGDRTIMFVGESDQDRTGVLFSSFNKIGVETAGTTATIGGADITITDALTVTGEGTLKLAANTGLNATQGITVEAGATVALNGNAATGDVVVNGCVDVVGGGSLNGSLTLAAGSNLTLWDGTATGSNSLLDMSVPAVEGASLLDAGNSLTIGGLFGLDVKVNLEGEVELISGIGSISGIEFDEENKVLAGDVLSDINGEDVDSKLYLIFEDGTLKLSAIAGMTDFYWEDTETTSEKWTEKLWSVKDNNGENLVFIKDAATRTDDVNAIFNNGKAETVLVDTDATVDDLTVSGAGSNYTFAADTTTPGTLTIEGKLTVTDSATATFAGALADVAADELEVSAGGTLNAGDVTIADAVVLNAGTLNVTTLESDSLAVSNGSALSATDIEIAGAVEVTGSSLKATNLLLAEGVVISGDAAKVEAALLKVGESGLSMNGGTLSVGSLFSDAESATAEITGGTVTIGGTTLSSTSVTGAEFVGASTLAGSEAHAIVVGGVTVDGAAQLSVSDATLTDGITVEEGGKLTLGGAIHLDTSTSDFALENKSTYAATADADDIGMSLKDVGNGFVSRNEIYTVVDGSLANVESYVTEWTVGADARVGEYADGKVTISESKDTTTYWVNGSVTLSNVSTNFVEETDTIMLNGGMLQMNEETALTIATNNENPRGTESILILQKNVTLETSQLSIADGTTLELRGQSGTTLDLGSDSGVDASKLKGLGEDTWMGTVTTAATDITDVASLGNAESSVELTGAVDCGVLDLGSVGTVHATNSLTVEGIEGTGELKVDGLTTLKKGSGSIGNAAFDGGLVLGSEEAADLVAAELTAASVELLQGSIEADTLVVGGALTVADGSVVVDSLAVEGATTVGGTAGSTLTVDGDASLTGGLELANDSEAVISGELNLGNGVLKYNDLDSMVTAGSLAGDKLALEVDTELLKQAVDSGTDVTLLTLTEQSSDAEISLNGGSNILSAFGEKYSYSLDWDAAGQNVTLDAVANKNYMKEKYSGAELNAIAGATLMDDAFASGAIGADGDLANILSSVDQGTMTHEGLASVAGSSTAALGMAFSGDVERQLRSIRNRTTTMGVNQCVVNEGMPYFNAWVNAEGNFGEMDKDGVASGYKLDSWGGTVGFDVDVNPNLTLGLALTAMYGDLTVDGPDMLDGDMDTYYVSAFARYSSRAWTHTFIGTIGMMDGSYERTVSHAGGKYTTEGDTDGMAFGLMYEVGRVFAIDEDGDACWQPIFNVAYRHTNVGGYTEKGGAAALKVDDQTLDTITLGAGARVQAVVGENIFNRTSVFEARALAKFDIGDTSSEADVAFIGGGRSAMVESAELGAFGVELGAGLSVPVGDENDGIIFFDVSAELRSGYTEFNGTVGYRINF